MSPNEPTPPPDTAVTRALERLGIPRDGVLFVHSAFKDMARDGHRAPAALAALVDHMAPGTLLLPTMSWRFVKPHTPLFDAVATPSNVGILTELFRTRYPTGRSLHPTHSVAGLGRRADAMLAEHHLDETPCSARSPFGRLAPEDAWVVMLGVGMDCCTLVHHVEEVVAIDHYLRPVSARETYTCHTRDGRDVTVLLRRHLFLPRDYWQFQDMLAQRGQLRVTRIDSAVCRAFRARDLVAAVTETLQARPDAVIARPGQRYRMM